MPRLNRKSTPNLLLFFVTPKSLLPLSSLLLLLLLSPAPMAAAAPAEPSAPLLAFLQSVQSAALLTLGPTGFDPKLYVDLPLKSPLSAAQEAFARLPRPEPLRAIPAPDLRSFLSDYFGDAGSDLVPAVPADFAAEPEGFLPGVENPKVRAWALEVHSLWRNLTRRVAEEVAAAPERHTLLPLPGPVVVPGSRFREVYYWDSYWTIRGLLVSKMYDTAKEIVLNLLSLIENYGFVPNGARSYYSNRSQPPLLSSMIRDIYLRTSDLAFVNRSLPLLLTEHRFWNSEFHKVDIQDVQGRSYSLSRYYTTWDKPRPEVATIDEDKASVLLNASEKKSFYQQLASTAESGWDFSSRWMRNSSDLTTLSTTSIIPVDLNAYILKMELDIAFFSKLLGDNSTLVEFSKASEERHAAIRSIFWNPEMGQWLDYWLHNESDIQEVYQWEVQHQNQNIFASNFIPMWVETYTSDGTMVEKVMKSLESSGLVHNAGIATSLNNTGQQWDFPNGWAPLQHMIIEGLAKSGSEAARSIAEDIAVRWIRTNYAAYKTTGAMHEKYDVEACGKIGGGGEYNPQTGFGWSNGVVLALLEEFGWPRDREIDCY